MRIPNKFNGYSRDGVRLYNDPATVTATLATMGETAAVSTAAAATIPEVAMAATAAEMAANPLLQGIQAGIGAYGGLGATGTGVASLLGAPTTAALAPEIAANLSAASGLANVAPTAAQSALGFQGFGAPVAEATGLPSVVPPALEVPAVTPVNTMQPMADVTNEIGRSQIDQLANRPVNQYLDKEFYPVAGDNAPLVEKAASGTTSYGPGIDESLRSGMPAPENMTGSLWDDTKRLFTQPNWQNIKSYASEHPYATAAGSYGLYNLMKPKQPKPIEEPQYVRPYKSTRAINPNVSAYQPYSGASTAERNWFTGGLEALPIYRAASGGITGLAVGGPVEQMSAQNAIGDNTMYPQAGLQTAMYSNPMTQRPMAENVVKSGVDTNVDPYTGQEKFAAGGISSLGGYSDGGRLLRGPGDGVSDSIPASIGNRQPARLADGEFVIPARIVSELGNGSTEAGARKLYAMMDRVQNARKKSVGKNRVAVNSKADAHLPA